MCCAESIQKDERQKLLDYLTTLEPDAYVLAITLAFYGIFRIGEIKGLVWDGKSNAITDQQQLVEERIFKDDFLSVLYQVLKILKVIHITVFEKNIFQMLQLKL